ncbi:MAG: hypothetical protein ACJA0Q_001641, partial [Saprospiraceae bacterium]
NLDMNRNYIWFRKKHLLNTSYSFSIFAAIKND